MKSSHDEVDLELVIAESNTVADGVRVLGLRREDGLPLPQWAPGAHIDLVLTPDITRQYSLCSDPHDRALWQIGVLREPNGRGGSQFVHDKLTVGDTVAVRGPRNHFALDKAERYLFIAGGIGITPILAMARQAEEHGAEWTLIYGGRTRSSMAFADDLTHHHPERVTLHPQDQHGLIDLDVILRSPRPDTLVYTCGPAPLLDAVTTTCDSYGWPRQNVHLERFTPKVLEEPVLQDCFDVELAATGLTLTVNPDESILAAVTAAGVNVLSSCEEGTCGTCETPVLDGIVDHRDSLLSDDEQAANDTMMICVSRARCARLVLDL